MTGLSFGPADPADPAVIALVAAHQAASREHYDEDDCHALSPAQMAASGVALHAAWLDRRLVGIAGLRDLGQGQVELKSMHVAQSVRGGGVARRLLAHVMDAARLAGYRDIVLEAGRVDDYAAPARALYFGAGFSECPPFGDYEDRPASIFLACTLAPPDRCEE